MVHQLDTQKSYKAAYLAWTSVALLFFYQYIIRVAPGAMVESLRQEFGFTATEFSYLGAFFLYGYAFMQVPVGLLLDRIGIRLITLVSIALCVVSTYLFAITSNHFLALMCRLLLGIGAATPFICCIKIASDHMPPSQKGFFSGAVLAVGTFGALCSGKPLSLLIENFGWRGSFEMASFFGVGIFVFGYIFLPKDHLAPVREHGAKEVSTPIVRSVLETFKSWNIMIYAVIAVGLYTPLSVLADLWGTAFIMEKYGLTQAEASQTTLSVYMGMMAGSLFLAWFAQKINRLNLMIRLCGVLMVLGFALLLYGPKISPVALTGLMIFIGFLCGAEMICFNGVARFTTPQTSGLTLAVVNTLNMLGGALLQKAIGFGLDWQWEGVLTDEGLRYYSTEQFVMSMTSLFVIMTLCILVSFRLKGR